jgi:hypothetical protein
VQLIWKFVLFHYFSVQPSTAAGIGPSLELELWVTPQEGGGWFVISDWLNCVLPSACLPSDEKKTNLKTHNILFRVGYFATTTYYRHAAQLAPAAAGS